MNMKIILASQSPRRKFILENLGLKIKIIPSTCKENTDKVKADEIVMDLALQKAQDVASREKNESTIIAADTIVYLDEKILGKPKDEEEAFLMLSRLQGAWHTVYTGVAIIFNDGRICNYYEKSDVHMSAQSDDDIWKYIKSSNVLDKAGAYGIQDSACHFVDEVKGETETVIGLPINRLKQELNL